MSLLVTAGGTDADLPVPSMVARTLKDQFFGSNGSPDAELCEVIVIRSHPGCQAQDWHRDSDVDSVRAPLMASD